MLDLTNKVISGRYRVEEYIDQGGMSYVYKAWDLLTERYIALKVLKPELARDKEFTERFNMEALAASKMKHENIVSLLDIGVEGDIRYLCLEFVQGKTIKEIIKEQGAIDEDKACQIIAQVLRALAHAHSKNIIHRDIKPDNIVIDDQGRAKVLDFGIARVSDTQTITRADVAIGTLQYVSPEQAKAGNVSAASDIYSLGLVFYEMLTGRRAFDGDKAATVIYKQLNCDPILPRKLNSRLSQGVENIIVCALQKNTNKRYSSANAMLDDVCQVMKNEEPQIANAILEEIKQEQIINNEVSKPNKVRRSETDRIDRANNVKKSVKKHFSVFLWSVPIFLIIIASIIFWGLNFISKVTQTVYAPDLIGLDHVKAVELARNIDVSPLIKYSYSNTVEKDIVIDQAPSEQTPMHRGDKITIEVSRGREDDVVPNLANISLRDAYNIASEKNFTISVVERIASKEIEEGIILEQLIRPGEPVPQNRIVQVKVSGGLVYVPNFNKLTLEEAIKRCHDLDLTLESVDYSDVDDPNMLGKVLKQSPDSGSAVILGTNIALVVGSADREYKGELVIETAGLELNTEIKVVLVEGNKEVIQYVGSYKPDGDSQMVVPIQSNFNKNIIAKVYIDGELKESKEVQLR